MKLAKLKPNRLWEISIVLLSVAFISFVCAVGCPLLKTNHLTLAAGSPTGESYIISSALKDVVERHYPRIKMTLLETGGTVESLKLLEEGRATLAAAQADVLAGPSARIIAVLYDDTFQLLTRRESSVRNFSDLRGATIALSQHGGQYQSFLRVAGHFALQPSNFRFMGATDASADDAFTTGRAEALFRVRSLGNPSIQRLVQTGNFRLVPIDHAAAMKINYPAFTPAVIPAGAYLGNPAVPAADLPSISVHRTLLSSAGVDNETIRAVTEVLIDRRQEIAEAIPENSAEVRLLLAQARRPDWQQGGLSPALHPGAAQFYDKDKPPFILAHADYMGLLLTIFVMIGSWIWELRAWLQRRQKNVADEYSNRVVALINAARETKSEFALEEIRHELLAILGAAVSDLDSDKLSQESFHSFRAILQIGLESVRDSWVFLQTTRH